MAKLFGSKKGKRLIDKSNKVSRPVDSTDMDDYSIDDIVMDSYLYGCTGTEDHSVDYSEVDYSGADYSGADYSGAEDQSTESRPTDESIADESVVYEHTGDNFVSYKRIRPSRSHRPFIFSRKHIIYASMLLIGIALIAIALRIVLSEVIEDAAARSEYDQIRENFPEVSGDHAPGIEHIPGESNSSSNNNEETDVPETTEEERALREMSMDELASINNDLIGWINANNSLIDYPVVRGSDNERYINTTFHGATNSAGTIFMDYRHLNGFDESVVILYGHRTRDGAMFSSLVNFLDPGFQSRNPNISIITRDGRRLTYVVFGAKLTDAWDPAYSAGVSESERASGVFPNAPANAVRFLLLSTCTSGNNDDERIIVFAALY